jgi:hypothetical protein
MQNIWYNLVESSIHFWLNCSKKNSNSFSIFLQIYLPNVIFNYLFTYLLYFCVREMEFFRICVMCVAVFNIYLVKMIAPKKYNYQKNKLFPSQWLIAQLVEHSLSVMKDPGSNLGVDSCSLCY